MCSIFRAKTPKIASISWGHFNKSYIPRMFFAIFRTNFLGNDKNFQNFLGNDIFLPNFLGFTKISQNRDRFRQGRKKFSGFFGGITRESDGGRRRKCWRIFKGISPARRAVLLGRRTRTLEPSPCQSRLSRGGILLKITSWKACRVGRI